MELLDRIREGLHLVAGVLIWPVLLGLFGLMASTLMTIGAFSRQLFDRWRGRNPAHDRDKEHLERLCSDSSGGPLDVRVEEFLQSVERRRWRGIHRLRLAVRVGPSLGLMGTLIPMANALQGLAEGNLPTLASNMVTAFAATVIGLTVSVVAYLVAAAREEWARADIEALTFEAERRVAARSNAGTA